MYYHSTLRTVKDNKDVYTEEMYAHKKDKNLAIIKYYHREKKVGDKESKPIVTAIRVYYEIGNGLTIKRDQDKEPTKLLEDDLKKLLKKELSFASEFYKQMKKLKT